MVYGKDEPSRLGYTWSWMMENIVEFVARPKPGFWLETSNGIIWKNIDQRKEI